MIRDRRAERAQLPLPFEPSVAAGLPQVEKEQVRRALARLLLSAAGIATGESADE